MSRRRLDVDRTRERLLGLGLAHAADQLEPLLSEAVKEGHAPHAVVDALLEAECWRASRTDPLLAVVRE